MAPNMEFVCVEVGKYLSDNLSLPVETVLDITWQERERRLDAGQIDLCWICGLPYVWKADRKPSQVEVLVAPVDDLVVGLSYAYIHGDFDEFRWG